MKSVDLIIKYLSGDLSQEKEASFEKELANNPDLKEEYEQVSIAYGLIRDQLRERDEAAFKQKLLKVMNAPAAQEPQPTMLRRFKWYFLLPLAGSVALVLALLLMNRSADRLFAQYFEPQKDPLVLAFSQGTRSVSDPWMALYNGRHYPEALDQLSDLIQREPENHVALLFYLLSSMEVELQESALKIIEEADISVDHQLDRSITWYTCLAMVKSGQIGEATTRLLTLSEQPGTYRRDAIRLRKMLLK